MSAAAGEQVGEGRRTGEGSDERSGAEPERVGRAYAQDAVRRQAGHDELRMLQRVQPESPDDHDGGRAHTAAGSSGSRAAGRRRLSLY